MARPNSGDPQSLPSLIRNRLSTSGRVLDVTVRLRSRLLTRLHSLVPLPTGGDQGHQLALHVHHSLESRHRYFREVRCFFNWLVTAGYLKETPFRSLHNVRLPQKIVQPFNGEEIARLLACCDPETIAGARDRAIILTLLDTGVRVGELVRVTVEDFDFERQRLRILYGKGNKQRIVRLGSRCQQAVAHYIQRFRGTGPGPVFRDSRRDRPLQNNGVKQMLRRLGREAGVAKVHAHRFRHTFATWAIENQARELDVQYLLGHSTPDMVRRYSATYNSEKAARAHELFSPADRLGERLLDFSPTAQ